MGGSQQTIDEVRKRKLAERFHEACLYGRPEKECGLGEKSRRMDFLL